MRSIIPGKFVLESGEWRDYVALCHFHYKPKRPRTWQQIWRIVHRTNRAGRFDQARGERVVAVGVLSWPTTGCTLRHTALNMRGHDLGWRIRFANKHIR